MELGEIMAELESLSNPENVKGRFRYSIKSKKAFGVRIPELRRIAKEVGKDHFLASQLWDEGYSETRILASMVEDPGMVTEKQMESWVVDFDSWDVCDQCCMNLFYKTPFAYKKAFEWSEREEEYVKRAAFTLMAVLAVHDKAARDVKFEQFFPVLVAQAGDKRNYVKKAVNWALRQIGKRNMALNLKTLDLAREMIDSDAKSAQWIARDAIRELESDKVQERLRKKREKDE